MPVRRLVSDLELEVMSSCLVRQGREVEEGIGSLQANLRYSEARIKGMYKEVFMQQQGYCLHTKMVHKGNTSTTQVTSSFTVIIDNFCTLHSILFLLSGDDSIHKSRRNNPVYSARSDDSPIFTCFECFTLHYCKVFS